MKYYVVSDVHGYYTKLREVLREAGFFGDTEPHKLIVCGDLLDRGDEACELVRFMMELLAEDKLIFILGNHEDLFVQCLQEISRGGVYEIASGMSHHYRNGTWDTLLQISGMSAAEGYSYYSELARSVMRSDFYRTLIPAGIDYFETSNYIFTHGWLPCRTEGYRPFIRCEYDEDWRNADGEAWRKARWYNGMELACKRRIKEPDKTVVCGHFHASYGHALIEKKGSEFGSDADHSPFYADGIIAIDGCVAVSGRINCIVIEE